MTDPTTPTSPMPPDIRHPCAGRTIAMQRCYGTTTDIGGVS